MKNKLNIILDIDDVIFSWQEAYASRFNVKIPKYWSNAKIMKTRLSILMQEKNFWLNLPLKNNPNFQPTAFVSARGIPKTWTVESLKINNIPGRSKVHQVKWGESKVDLLKLLKCGLFIDDKVATFKECIKSGIPCLLMDASHNQSYSTKYRIYDLNYETILKKYNEIWKSK